MMYSSSKASVAAAAAEAGVKVDHMVEIRSANEINDAVSHAMRSKEDGGGMATGASPSMPTPAPMAKPSRPGRGRARLTKRMG
ncbi:unnamed protein product [Choristocarpus tenellus]